MMKKENYINVQMERVEDSSFPILKVEFIEKDEQGHSGLLIVDSCSEMNVLFSKMAGRLKLFFKMMDETITIKGIGDETLSTNVGKLTFSFGGKQFVESFCINEHKEKVVIYGDKYDLSVVGILGNQFLQHHNLVIDYGDYSLHTSNYNLEKLPFSECDYFFPMEKGLKNYGIPVLSLRQNGRDFVVLADTGSSNNIIAPQAIIENGFERSYMEKTNGIDGMTSHIEAKYAKVRFNLQTQTNNATEELFYEDYFMITPYNMIEEGFYFDENANPLPPVVGIIGSPFMANEEWVLDFGIKYIYKRKK